MNFYNHDRLNIKDWVTFLLELRVEEISSRRLLRIDTLKDRILYSEWKDKILANIFAAFTLLVDLS